MLTIAELWTYPVKSLQGAPVAAAEVTPGGSLRGDREWLVVDGGGRMLWQGDMPRMAMLSAGLDASSLRLARPDGAAIELPRDHGGDARRVMQYGFEFDGVDAGEAAAELLSDWLGAPVRLVRIGAQAHAWPKLNPVHLLSEASIEALAARLGAEGGAAVLDVRRFRPNVVLAGAAAPFEEERRAVLDFGTARLVLVAPATRCVLVNVDPDAGVVQRQPLPLIARMSRERATALRGSFGVYARAEGAELRPGMGVAEPFPA